MEPTVVEIFDIENDDIIYANNILQQEEGKLHNLRFQLEEAIQNDEAKLVCLYCEPYINSNKAF